MLITYHGHSEFYLEAANGFALLTDPYDAHVGYPMGEYRADAVTVTHGHGDHNYTAKATGAPAIIDQAGEWYPAPEVKVTAIPSVHDDAGGAKRGPNLIMKIEMEGLTLVHLGDQGAPLTAEQIKAIGNADILMLPIGGFYTIDSQTAYGIVQAVKPRIVSHYDGSDILLSEGIISSPSKFPELLKHVGEDLIVTDGHTLLGADDKAGIAEIVQAMCYLRDHQEIRHGDIRIAFNPDEEIAPAMPRARWSMPVPSQLSSPRCSPPMRRPRPQRAIRASTIC